MSVAATNWVWTQSKAEGADRLVLLALADFADEDGNCFGSWGKLSEKTKLHRATVARSLRRLQKSGELTLVEKGHRKLAGDGAEASIWRLPVASAEMGRNLRPVAICDPSGSTMRPKWSQSATPTISNIKERRDSEPPPVASLPPAPQPTSPPKKRRERKPHPVLRADLDDEAWLAHVKTLPQYAHVNFDALLERCIAWCAAKGDGAPSRMRLVKWADKEQKPLTIGTKRKDDAAERRRQKMLEEELEMKRAFAAAQEAA